MSHPTPFDFLFSGATAAGAAATGLVRKVEDLPFYVGPLDRVVSSRRERTECGNRTIWRACNINLQHWASCRTALRSTCFLFLCFYLSFSLFFLLSSCLYLFLFCRLFFSPRLFPYLLRFISFFFLPLFSFFSFLFLAVRHSSSFIKLTRSTRTPRY